MAEEDTITVAFLGPLGSFSHQATRDYFRGRDINLASQKSFPDVFTAVHERKAKYGLVPLENSSNGVVDATIDCLVDACNEYPCQGVLDESFLDVEHCLLGWDDSESDKTGEADDWLRIERDSSDLSAQLDTETHVADLASQTARLDTTTDRDSSDPNAQLSPKTDTSPSQLDTAAITDIYSHQQALGQCRRYIQHNLPHANLHGVASTSEAATMVSRMRSRSAVAIASRMAGELSGLTVLQSPIQDRNDNQTRFLVLCRAEELRGYGQQVPAALMKTMMLFSVDHSTPGALVDALTVFKRHGFNLSSFNQRPSGVRPGHYAFLVEAQFTADSGDTEKRLHPLMKELTPAVTVLKFLGSWPTPIKATIDWDVPWASLARY